LFQEKVGGVETALGDGVLALLDEQLANYRPVWSSYLRWISDAASGTRMVLKCNR